MFLTYIVYFIVILNNNVLFLDLSALASTEYKIGKKSKYFVFQFILPDVNKFLPYY